MEIYKIFFKKTPMGVILSLKENKQKNGSILARKIDSTYSHTNKILRELQVKGLVSLKKEGRQNIISLTKKGNRFADLLHELKNIK